MAGVDTAPLDPPGKPVTGDSHAHLLAPLEAHAVSLGYTVSYEPLEGRAGYCSARDQRIVIDTALPANGTVTTLVHELAHAHGIDYQRFSRPEAELIVESVACIVCAGPGPTPRTSTRSHWLFACCRQPASVIGCSPSGCSRSFTSVRPDRFRRACRRAQRRVSSLKILEVPTVDVQLLLPDGNHVPHPRPRA